MLGSRWPLVPLALGAMCVGCRRPDPDPYAIVKDVAATYHGARDYHVIFTTRIPMKPPQATRTQRVEIAGAADGRFRMELSFVPGDSVIDVSDGNQEWTYFTQSKEYVVNKAGTGGDSPALHSADNSPEVYSAIDRSSVREVKWLRRDDVVLEGHKLTCDVVSTGVGTLWIERERHRVVRAEQEFSDGSRWATEFLLVHLNEQPPPDLFASPVPSDAQQTTRAKPRLPSETPWGDRYKRAVAELAVAQDHERDRHFRALTDAAKAAFELGKIDEARQHAQELLDLAADYRENFAYGQAIHDGHMVLGRVAIQKGDLATGRGELLKAGKTPGGPRLNSYGPNMSLAKDLLERGDIETVLEYFRLCGAFWQGEPVGGEASVKLMRWTQIARAGQIPNFGITLRY